MMDLMKKIVRVRSKIGAVKKTGYNKFSHYAYYTQEDIDGAIRPLLDAEGIAVLPCVRGYRVVEDLVIVKLSTTFFDCESGQEYSTTSIGTARWSQVDEKTDRPRGNDKSIYTAITGAYKYTLMKMFGLSESADNAEDDTHDIATPPRKASNDGPSSPIVKKSNAMVRPPGVEDPQWEEEVDSISIGKRMWRTAQDHGWDVSTLKKYLRELHGLDSLRDVPSGIVKDVEYDLRDIGVRLTYQSPAEA